MMTPELMVVKPLIEAWIIPVPVLFPVTIALFLSVAAIKSLSPTPPVSLTIDQESAVELATKLLNWSRVML
jgi:hypothetical protein